MMWVQLDNACLYCQGCNCMPKLIPLSLNDRTHHPPYICPRPPSSATLFIENFDIYNVHVTCAKGRDFSNLARISTFHSNSPKKMQKKWIWVENSKKVFVALYTYTSFIISQSLEFFRNFVFFSEPSFMPGNRYSVSLPSVLIGLI